MRFLLKSALIVLPHLHFLSATWTSDPPFIASGSSEAPRQGLSQENEQDLNAQSGRFPQLLPLFRTTIDSPSEGNIYSHSEQTPRTLDLLGQTGAIGCNKRKSSVASTHDVEDVQAHQQARKKHHLDLNLPNSRVGDALSDSSGTLVSDGGLGRKRTSPDSSVQDAEPARKKQQLDLNLEPARSSDASAMGFARPEFQAGHSRGSSRPSAITSPPTNRILTIEGQQRMYHGKDTRAATSQVASGTVNMQPTGAIDTGFSSAQTQVPTKTSNESTRRHGEDTNLCLVFLDAEFWAWLSIIWNRVQDVTIKEFHESFKPSLSQLMSAYVRKTGPNLGETSRGDAQMGAKCMEFAHLLWAFNWRTLDLMGATHRRPTYIKQQEEFLKWFLHFMWICRDPAQCLKIQGGYVHEKIMAALNCQEDSLLYRVYRQGVSKSPILVPTKQLMMNEAAAHVLTFYYKSTNLEKWRYLFEKDMNFPLKLAHFGARWTDRLVKRLPRDSTKKKPESLIPWRNPLNPNSPKYYSDKEQIKFAQFVTLIDPIDGANTDQHKIHKRFSLKDHDTRVWAWISRIGAQVMNDHLIDEQKSKSHQKSIGIIMTYLEEVVEQRSGKDGKMEFLHKYGKRIPVTLKRLLFHFWIINYAILEALGCYIPGRAFYDQQELARSFAEYFFSQGKNERFQLQEPDEKDGMDSLLLGLITTEQGQKVYTVKNSNHHDAGSSLITRDQIIMTQIVVHILGFYYKNGNYEKWTVLFGEDENMLNFLIKYRVKGFSMGKLNLYREKFLPNVRLLRAIPWGTRSEFSSGNLPDQARRLFKTKSKMAFERWMEEFHENRSDDIPSTSAARTSDNPLFASETSEAPIRRVFQNHCQGLETQSIWDSSLLAKTPIQADSLADGNEHCSHGGRTSRERELPFNLFGQAAGALSIGAKKRPAPAPLVSSMRHPRSSGMEIQTGHSGGSNHSTDTIASKFNDPLGIDSQPRSQDHLGPMEDVTAERSSQEAESLHKNIDTSNKLPSKWVDFASAPSDTSAPKGQTTIQRWRKLSGSFPNVDGSDRFPAFAMGHELEIFRPSRSHTGATPYAEQQKAFLNWFIDFMLACKSPSRCSQITGDYLYQKIIRAFMFKEGPNVYRVFRKGVTTSAILVSTKQLLMNEAAIHVLTFYYKNTNSEKWEYLFLNDINFVHKLGNYGK
ncbi:hypothetical protein PSHT_15157, partial [Puccinia striiformis]